MQKVPKVLKYSLFAMLLCLPSLVKGQTAQPIILMRSGNEFLQFCEAPIRGDNTSGHGLECSAFMVGVVEGFWAYAANSKVQLFASPEDATTSQFSKIVVKYMNDHPKELNLRTARLILMALQDAYPPKKNPL